MNPPLKGVYSVLPTPFNDKGEVDIAGLRRVIDLYLRAGVDGLTACGVTSETARLNEAERTHILETVIAHVEERLPVVIGTSSDGLRTCIDLTKRAAAMGASAVMISPPRMTRLNSDSVIKHFRAVSDAVDIPIIIQDYPPVSGFSMEPSLLSEIVRDIESARMIKLEDPPTPCKIARVLERVGGIPLGIFGGLGGTYLLEELMAGATGTMTGFAVPEVLVKVVGLFRSGDVPRASEIFYRTVPLMRFEFQEGIGMVIRKEILGRRGALDCSDIRPPGMQLDSSTRTALDSVLSWFKQQNKDIPWILD